MKTSPSVGFGKNFNRHLDNDDTRDWDAHDPRDVLMRDLDLPRGDERELVVDRERVYELDGEDSRVLAAAGALRIVPEHDLDVRHETLENLTIRDSWRWVRRSAARQ